MAAFQKRIIIIEAIFIVVYWLVVFVVPYLISFQIRESLADMVDYIPLDLSMLVAGFTLWLDVYIMKFHRDLLYGLSLNFKWFTPLKVPPFIQIAARILTGWKTRDGNGKAEMLHLAYCQSLYMSEGIGKFPKLYMEVKKHDKKLLPYEYVNLRHARAIRVLRLSPSDSDTAPLVCSIEEVILDVSPAFEALSYAWDDEKGDGYVICNGAVLRVSKNCAAALRRIRIQQGQSSKRLWVDAICINQVALAEKVRQLAMMGEIYKKAKKVIVWLGEHDESSIRVLKFFAVVAESYKRDRQRSQATTATEALQMVRRWHLFGEALAQFFKRSWFTRMWPIQEVTLPHRGRVQMLCGTTEMSFENLRFGWDVLKTLGLLPTAVNLDQAVALQFYIADAIALKRDQGQNASTAFSTPLITDLSQFSLSSVMNATRYKACKYPKDKFFALYGVFQELEISFDITPSMYNDKTDVDIMTAVMVACLKHDENLDALRLCHLAEPYISSDDYVRTRQDPYDSLSTAVFGMTRRMGRAVWNVYQARDLDYVPGLEWRITLPSWVPDWTQWTTRSPDPIRDIQFLHSYSSVFVQVSDRAVSAPAQSSSIASAVCRVCLMARRSKAGCLGPTTHWEISGSVLNVEAKIFGPVTDIGSVDSIAVLWQVLMPNFNPSLSWSRSSSVHSIWNFGHRSPDPALAALVETVMNFVWRSRMAQVFISLRMALKTLGFVDVLAYIGAVSGVGWTGPWSKEFLCMRHASIASCPTDGFAMRKQTKRGGYAEAQFITTMINNFINGRKPWNSDMWYDLTGTALATLSYLLWDCRVSISESLFGGRYDEMEWWTLAPAYVYIMSALVQTVAGLIGDVAFMLLGQAVTGLTGIWGLVVLLVWARAVTGPVLVIFGVRACYKSPRLVLGVGLEEFRPVDAFTPGMHFFSTEGGITGNSSGPVRKKDLLVMVRGCCDYSILRQREGGFILIGSAYVGKKTRQTTDKEAPEWTKIALY